MAKAGERISNVPMERAEKRAPRDCAAVTPYVLHRHTSASAFAKVGAFTRSGAS